MQKTQNIRIEDFNYPLPDERIAKFPLSKRDDSKLLVYRKGEIEEHRFHELPKVLPADSLLVFNNTRVIQARLHFRKRDGCAHRGILPRTARTARIFPLVPIDRLVLVAVPRGEPEKMEKRRADPIGEHRR